MPNPRTTAQDPNKTTGYRCQHCTEFAFVVDSRPSPHGWRRRRACPSGHRFTTYETTVSEGKDFVPEIEEAIRTMEQAEDAIQVLSVLLDKMHDRARLAKAMDSDRYAGVMRVPNNTSPEGFVTDEQVLASYGFPGPGGMD